MGIPPRDESGNVTPYDDPDISNESYVIRYIPSGALCPDQHGGRRLSSGAFSKSSKKLDPHQGMSVDLLDAMEADGVQPRDRAGEDHVAIVKLNVGSLRALGLTIGYDPQDENPYHTEVWGVTGGIRKKILCLKEWIFKPDNVL